MNELPEVEQKLSNAAKVEVFNEAKAAGPQETIDRLVEAGIIDIKPWWRSMGINVSVGTMAVSLGAIIVAVAKMVGHPLDENTATLLAGGLLGISSGAATWWGRMHATQPISTTQVLPGVTLGGTP